MKKIMILGASILQLPAIEKAKKMGLDVIAADMNPQAVGFDVPGIKKEVISTIDTPAILEAAKRHQIDGIMTLATDMPMRSVAVVCGELGPVGISEETALKATNKAYMRDALKECNVPIPMYYRINGKTEFRSAVTAVWNAGFQCIVKPADNSGSRGINLLSADADLDKAYEYTSQFSRSGEIMVEEYMEGPEVSVETLALNGVVHVIQITHKITTGSPYVVERGHSQPSRLDSEVQQRIREVTVAANKAIGIDNGPSHTEIKVTKNGPKIVELGARLGGDCITTHLVPLSTGVDMVENTIRIALGESPDLKVKWNKGSAISYFCTDRGVLTGIDGIEEAKACQGVEQVSIVRKIGEKIDEIKSSVDRPGFVISTGIDAEDAERNGKRAVSKVSFLIAGGD